jgi:alpha-glucuronidase
VGFDRTSTGSNALEQYSAEVQRTYQDPKRCPEQLLLWFHHVGWDEPLASGNTLWEGLCHAYTRGVERVRQMRAMWLTLSDAVDAGRFDHVLSLLDVQLREAEWWRNACLLYFQAFSKRAFPTNIEPPEGTLEEYMQHQDHYVPGS